MIVSSWKDLGNVWGTLRELDIHEIREESERPLFIACVGRADLFATCAELLQRSNDNRYNAIGPDPLSHYDLSIDNNKSLDHLHHADALVMLVDGRQALTRTDLSTLRHLDSLALPLLLVVLHGTGLPTAAAETAPTQMPLTRVIALPNIETAGAVDTLAEALLTTLPSELHLTSARRLPGLRPIVARNLINNSSFSNAAYSLASGLPEQIPVVGVPFAAADMLILTKNQAMLVYKLALGHGAPPEFQARIREVLPVVGGAYVWRQLARSLVGLIPVWGLLPKVAIAYAGTYTTGIVAWRWYATGEIVSGDRLKQVSQDALQRGREQARTLLEQAREHRDGVSGRVRHFVKTRRLRWPGAKQKPETTPPELTSPSD